MHGPEIVALDLGVTVDACEICLKIVPKIQRKSLI